MTSEEELNTLKERLMLLEEDNKFLSERLRALEKRFEQMDEAQMWQEESDRERHYGYW